LIAIEFLLRITVAVPVSVATFPIGSSAAAGAGAAPGAAGAGTAPGKGVGEGVGPGTGAGAGWVCASFVAPDIAATPSDGFSSSIGEGIAITRAIPASMKQPTSESAIESRRRVTTKSRARGEQTKCRICD
jgi:hypothetical protein